MKINKSTVDKKVRLIDKDTANNITYGVKEAQSFDDVSVNVLS